MSDMIASSNGVSLYESRKKFDWKYEKWSYPYTKS
jgi:hypothetical protein